MGKKGQGQGGFIGVRVPVELRLAARLAAVQRGQSVSEFVRGALQRELGQKVHKRAGG